MNGIILLDKEPGMTSFEAVKKVKKILAVKKAGHAGTLDKFATGLLIICLGKATSLQNIFMHLEKVYRALIRFGKQTDTLDPYGRVIKNAPVKRITKDEVIEVLNSFVGEIEQYPPVFSAIWVDGKRMYRRVLNGEQVDLQPRKVHVHWIKLIDVQKDGIIIEAKVSKGTYIRSLARDIASNLGTVGYCESLRRISIGEFRIENSIKINNVTPREIIPIEKAISFLPMIEIDIDTAKKVSSGFSANRLFSNRVSKTGERYIGLINNGRLVALLENNVKLRYFKVFGIEQSENY